MSPKRNRSNSFYSRRVRNKRKKLNLITLRQKNDYRTLGESHPANTVDTVKNYTKIEDKSEKEDESSSSSSESDEEDIPVLKQLLDVIGVKEEDPESEQEDEDESSSEVNSEEELLNKGAESDDSENDKSFRHGSRTSQTKTSSNTCLKSEHDTDSEDEGGEPKPFIDDEVEEDDIGNNDDELVEDESEENEDEFSNFIDDEAVEDNDVDDKESDDEEFIESDDLASDEDEDGISESSEQQGTDMTTKRAQEKKIATKKTKRNTSRKSKQKDKIKETKDDDNDELCLKESDPFSQHFEIEIEETELNSQSLQWQKKETKVPCLGKGFLMYKHPNRLADVNVTTQLKQMHVKHKLCDGVVSINKQTKISTSKSYDGLSNFQHKLFCVLNSYQDILYSKQDFSNMEQIRLVYCLHVVNHVLKTRSRIMSHNAKLQNKSQNNLDDVEYRDQGLTRPKVLILLPYRDRALKVFNIIYKLLSASQEIKVSSRKRFETEFSELEKREVAGKKYKSDDFIKMFEGNVDDNFRVGMCISKKSLRFYSPFYESDIILASPLGLRTVIGSEGDSDRDFDFLSSIEILIMDQTDVFLMQNWDHVSQIFKHLHLQPKEAHGTDFSRVRMWAIDGLSKHFRQTVILSNVLPPEIMTIFNKQCHNYSGKILIHADVKNGSIGSCLSDAAQIFHRIPCDKPDGISQRNAKLDYMKKKVIPHHTSRGMNQTLIYCNYFSFVLLRNYFREADVDFLFINEYDSEKSISNTRIKFRKKSPHFLLYTERLHFHHRFRLKGIHHIVWFDAPLYPHFYPEMVNLMEVMQQTCTSTCLFTKYDAQKLMAIVGQKRVAHMFSSEKSVHMITVS